MGINIDGSDVSDITIDGQQVQEVTIDGTTVWTNVTVLEDFESYTTGSAPSGYGGDTASATVQTGTVIEGSKTLEMTGSFTRIGNTSISTPRGNTYKIRTRNDTSAGVVYLLINCQSTSAPFADCYGFEVDWNAGEFSIIDRTGASTNSLGFTNVSPNLGETYTVEATTTASDISGRLLDSNGTELASLGPFSDSTHTGGGIGFYRGPDNGPTYFDYVTQP